MQLHMHKSNKAAKPSPMYKKTLSPRPLIIGEIYVVVVVVAVVATVVVVVVVDP
jgi:hypothetical protein